MVIGDSTDRVDPVRRLLPPGWDGGPDRRAEKDLGITSLEMAILFPTVLLVILAMFQISLYWHTANAVAVAAQEAVDAGQVFPDDEVRAESEATQAALWILNTTNHRNGMVDTDANGDLITVTVTAEAPRIVGIGTWRVRSQAQGRMEEFVPADQR